MGNYFCIGKTYISLICQDEETATQNLEALNNQFGIEGISKILGNEILIEVTKEHPISTGLKGIRNALVKAAKVDMFDANTDDDGNICRYWYNLIA